MAKAQVARILRAAGPVPAGSGLAVAEAVAAPASTIADSPLLSVDEWLLDIGASMGICLPGQFDLRS